MQKAAPQLDELSSTERSALNLMAEISKMAWTSCGIKGVSSLALNLDHLLVDA